MAYQFSTGFDFYTSSLQIFDTRQLTTETISSANARFTGTHSQGCLVLQNGFLRKNLTAAQRMIAGIALKTSALSANGTVPIRFEDSGTAQVDLLITQAGGLQFYRGDPTTNPIGSAASSGTWTSSVWHYLEIDVTVHNTTGAVACWLDGVQIINSSGLNTRASSNNSVNQVTIGEIRNSSASNTFDDMYVLDGTGSSLNSVLGDTRIITIMPAATGDFSQFTPVGDSPNWKCVDEIPADDDTTYVSDGTVNDRDSYGYESIATNGANPNFVVPWARVKKDDAGSHTVQLSVRNGGVDAFSSSISVPSSYTYINGSAFTTNPNGGGVWDQTGVNGTQFGLKIIT